MIDTNEFSRFSGATTDATVRAVADGKFGFDDLTGYIRPGTLASDGIKGLGNIGREYHDATPGERDADDDIFASELSSLSENKRDLSVRAQSGLKAVFALVTGGAEENAAVKIAAFLEERMTAPVAAGETVSPPSAAELLAVVRER